MVDKPISRVLHWVVIKPPYELIDSEKRAQKHPNTWAHPPAQALNLIVEGCYVQAMTPTGMIVKVEQVDMLRPDLHGVNDEDVLEIEPRHVFGIVDGAALAIFN